MTNTPHAYASWRPYAVLILLFLFQTLNFFDKLVFGLSAVPMMKELAISPSSSASSAAAFSCCSRFPALSSVCSSSVASRSSGSW